MMKWQYAVNIHHTVKDLRNSLDAAASEGWELVSVTNTYVPDVPSPLPVWVMILKKPA